MKKEYPFSIRINQEIADGIKWATVEHEWKNDSEAGRNILAIGINYLKKVKEVSENPKIATEINQKMSDFMKTLSRENIVNNVLKKYDDEMVELIFSAAYLEDKQRKSEKEMKIKNLRMAEKEAKNREEEERLRKTTQHTMILKLDNGKWVEVKCFRDIDNNLADANGNKIQKEIFLDPVNLPEGVEFLGDATSMD